MIDETAERPEDLLVTIPSTCVLRCQTSSESVISRSRDSHRTCLHMPTLECRTCRIIKVPVPCAWKHAKSDNARWKLWSRITLSLITTLVATTTGPPILLDRSVELTVIWLVKFNCSRSFSFKYYLSLIHI